MCVNKCVDATGVHVSARAGMSWSPSSLPSVALPSGWDRGGERRKITFIEGLMSVALSFSYSSSHQFCKIGRADGTKGHINEVTCSSTQS